MSVPITPSNFDDLSFWAEYEIGLAWQILTVKTVTVAQSVYHLPHGHFRGSVL
jgi:hypothetical protein